MRNFRTKWLPRIAYVVAVLSMAAAIFFAAQPGGLDDKSDRNATLTILSQDGLRCFLRRLNKTPNVQVTSIEINECYAAYDEYRETIQLHLNGQ